MAKKWIFERGAQKFLKNEGQFRVQHEKICQNSEVPELYGNLELRFLKLPDYWKYLLNQSTEVHETLPVLFLGQ